MPGYVWSGNPEPPKPAPPPKQRAPRKNQAECGTYSGYKTHGTRGQKACRACKDAMAAYCREYRARVKLGEIVPRKGFVPDNCGSHAGYARHRKYGQAACQPCLTANAEYMRAYNARKREKALQEVWETNTPTGKIDSAGQNKNGPGSATNAESPGPDH